MEPKHVRQEKPTKRTDKELWQLIAEKIGNGNYLLLKHAKKRQKDRNISDVDVLDILENKNKRERKRNKIKDKYIDGYQDWNYCIEGYDLDGDKKIRIIISFDIELMLIVTVIRLDS